MSSLLCKKERGDLLAFRIVVKEDRIENPFHTVAVHEDTHRSSSSLDFSKRSFYQIGGANLAPQGHLSFLDLLSIKALSLFYRKLHLVKREQLLNL